jgi:hypothetical protein
MCCLLETATRATSPILRLVDNERNSSASNSTRDRHLTYTAWRPSSPQRWDDGYDDVCVLGGHDHGRRGGLPHRAGAPARDVRAVRASVSGAQRVSRRRLAVEAAARKPTDHKINLLVRDAAVLVGVTLDELPHAAASRLINGGPDPVTVAGVPGHENANNHARELRPPL